MQLSLTTTLPRHPRAAVLRPLVPLSREAAMSQLDQIAAASSQRITRQDGLGGVSTVLALVGGLVLVGAAAMWRAPAETAPGAAPAMSAPAPASMAATPQPAAPESAVATATPPVSDAPAIAVLRDAAPEAAPASTVAEPAPAEVAAAIDPSADELAQRARARQLAEARRKAAALAQERMVAEEAQRLQAAAQRREAELAAQQAEEQRRQRAAVADAAARPVQVVSQVPSTRRSVREVCNGRGLFAEGACHVRECARSEHQADPVCVRLRESDEAQRRASIER